MTILSYMKDYNIDLSGSGGLADELEEYYDRISSDSIGEEVHIECEIGNIDPEPEHILGKPTNYYGREGDWFLRVDKHKVIRIHKDWSKIQFTPSVPRAWAFKLLEYPARRHLAHTGYSLIHASSAQVGNKTVAFPAWQHTGKTNTLLTLIQRYGADYLSDDRVWLGSDRTIRGFALPVNLLPYNYHAFPNIEPPTQFYKHRYHLSNIIRNISTNTGSFLSRALYFANEFYLSPSSQKVQIEDIHPDVKYVDETTLDSLICLQTVADDSRGVQLTEITSERAKTHLESISYHEWNGMIQGYVNAFDVLFDEIPVKKNFESFLRTESAIWTEVLDSVETYILTIPREDQWKQTNLSKQVLEELSAVLEN